MAVANLFGPTPAGPLIARQLADQSNFGRLDPALSILAADPGAPTVGGLALMRDDAGRVAVTVTSWDVDRLLPRLGDLGFRATYASRGLNTIEGFLPVGSFAAAATLGGDGLLGILPAYRPMTGVGSVTSQADYIFEADRARQVSQTGLNGAGLRVGILSDSFNRLGGYAADVASGDLPGNVNLVLEGPAGSADEGRGMAQLVADVAPGAGLAFASAFYNQGAFADSIRDLANPAIGNASIITDDIFYFEEPQFQDGVIAQAISDVTANRNVAYFSLAGNLGTNAYESTNIGLASDPFYVGNGPNFYDFDPGSGVDTRQRITLTAGQSIILNLQWDDPFYTTSGVDTDLGFYLLSGDTIVASSNRNNLTTQLPSEIFGYTNATGSSQALDLLILRISGPTPARLKWVNFGANNYGAVTVNEYATNSPTVIPHSMAPGGVSVAAAPAYDQLNPESYTSTGPFTALYSPTGVRLATPQVRPGPAFTSIDGTDTTFFGSDFDGNGRPNFFGTSAAAPHAAAVAALLRQAAPNLSPSQVYARLAGSATDIVNAGLNAGVGFDNRTGAGLINAFDAIYGPAIAAAPPVRDGFESSALSINWETYANGAARTLVTTANGPATGSYHLTMDAGFEGVNIGLNEATLRVDPTGAAGNLLLAFRQKEFLDEDDAMPASFTGRGNYDGVALSVDGTTWYRLVSLTGAASTGTYQNFLFNLTAFAAANGLTLGSNTRIRFQHYDNFGIPSDGFAFDDVRVVPAAAVTATTVDDGGVQRSVVRTVDLDVAGLVAVAPGTAFRVTRLQDGATFTPTVAVTATGSNRSRIRLTFVGTGTAFGSLPDGDYTLVADGGTVLDDLGAAVDADADGTPGGSRTVAFFRLFGDTDGDRDVDGTDFNVFRQAYAGQIPYLTYLDFNNNGTIANDTVDRDAFLARRGKRLTAVGVVFA